MIMRKTTYQVELFYGGEQPDEIKTTTDIEEARKWVSECEHGIILNEQGIAVQ
mgnify:CR=1 FL=1